MSQGCLDRFCYLTGPRSGQVTNGGCRCVTDQQARAALMNLWRENERLRAALRAVVNDGSAPTWVIEKAREALSD